MLQVNLSRPCTGCTSTLPEMERRRHALWNFNFFLFFLALSRTCVRTLTYVLLWTLPIFGACLVQTCMAEASMRDDQVSRLEIGRRNTRFDIACMHDGVVKAGLLCQVMVCSRGQVACCLDLARRDGLLSSRRKPSCEGFLGMLLRYKESLRTESRRWSREVNGIFSDCL